MLDANHFLGFLSNAVRIILILPIFIFWKKPKLKKLNYKWIVAALIGSTMIYVIGLFIWPKRPSTNSIYDLIFYTLILAPFIEELIHRYLILGGIITNIEKPIRFRDFAIFFYLSVVLILPDFVLYKIEWITNKPDYLIFVFMVSIPVIAFFISRSKIPKRFPKTTKIFLYGYTILMTSMAFLLMHNVFATQSQFVGGVFFGVLYLISGNIIPPIIAHFAFNLLNILF